MSIEESNEPQGSKNNRPKCHANSFRPSNRSIPDLINDPANQLSIRDEQMARAELEQKLFITPAMEITLESLTTMLLNFLVQAHSLTPMHVDVIRAIAILLFKTDHDCKV